MVNKVKNKGFVRARQSHQKENRKDCLLLSAMKLFSRSSFANISISQIAKSAQLAKGSVYSYFQTKEEIFLDLLLVEIKEWSKALEKELNPIKTQKEILRLMVESLKVRPEMLNLFSILNNILEHNIDLEKALIFKRNLLEVSLRLGSVLDEKIDHFKLGDGSEFIFRFYALANSFWQSSKPSKVMEQVFKKDEKLRVLQRDFGIQLLTTSNDLIEGMKLSRLKKVVL